MNMPATTPATDQIIDQPLALLGGPRVLSESTVKQQKPLFHWPIVTEEDEQAVIEVLRAGSMSGTHITREFEKESAEFHGVAHALGYPNGTMALQAAMWAVGLGRGDEMICPSITYWASTIQVFSLGATVVFGDVDPQTLCLDPADIERHIGPRTKAIMVVHYCGHPADMDAINAIARKHKLKVIEDVSHAQGSLYKGRLCGTMSDVAAYSMMGAKSLAAGEAGMLITDSREVYERAMSYSHYERTRPELTDPQLRAWTGADMHVAGLPLGGVKGRMNQTCAAMGRVQLKHYPARIAEIQKALTRFWDLLEGVPGLRAHRPARDSGSTMGGWYNPVGHYLPEELGGMPVEKFIEAVKAEGAIVGRGLNFPLHPHPLFNEADIYGDGKPTRLAFAERDVRQPLGSLPVSEGAAARAYGIPWFKHDDAEAIALHAAAYRKVATQAAKLMG